MANNLQLSFAAVNAQANALAALCNAGKLWIYSGAVPARADDSLGSAILLAELTMNATAFGSAFNGVLTANSITGGTAVASGEAAFYRIYDSGGSIALIQGTVGTSGCDMNLDNTSISEGAAVSITSLTHTVPRGA